VVEQAEELNFPTSVVEYFQGLIGHPPHGFPEPLRARVLKGAAAKGMDATVYNKRPGLDLPPVDLDAKRAMLEKKFGKTVSDEDVMSHTMYPKVFEDYCVFKSEYGPVEGLPTPNYLLGLKPGQEIEVELQKGKRVNILLKTIGVADAAGRREVFFELNGQPRTLYIIDSNTTGATAAKEKADKLNDGSIGAPMPGEVTSVRVEKDQEVMKGDPIIVMSAMKMETVVGAPVTGRVTRVAVAKGEQIQGGDLICEILPWAEK